jgi:hypothetical protein
MVSGLPGLHSISDLKLPGGYMKPVSIPGLQDDPLSHLLEAMQLQKIEA